MDWVALAVGTVLGLVSLTADLLGIGGYPGFGWKQVTGTVVAAVLVAVAGVRIARRQRRDRS